MGAEGPHITKPFHFLWIFVCFNTKTFSLETCVFLLFVVALLLGQTHGLVQPTRPHYTLTRNIKIIKGGGGGGETPKPTLDFVLWRYFPKTRFVSFFYVFFLMAWFSGQHD